MEDSVKICPFRLANMPPADKCIGVRCAYWCDFADECAVPLLAGLFADSDTCNTKFSKVEADTPGREYDARDPHCQECICPSCDIFGTDECLEGADSCRKCETDSHICHCWWHPDERSQG